MTDITAQEAQIAQIAQFGAPRRQHARHFFGTMGAAMRRTSQWLETRRNVLADTEIRRTHRSRMERPYVRGWHCD